MRPPCRKSKLFERLKSKLSKDKKLSIHKLKPKQLEKNYSQRTVRKVEIGWMHYDGQGFVQMRAKKGGGTRKLSVPKDWKGKN